MVIDYSKLWKLLIDKKILKKDLAKITGLSTSTISKLSANQNVNTDVLLKICTVLDCDIGDIAEIKRIDNRKKRVLSLFSGCGGMDIGFEGGFNCLRRSINTNLHPKWVDKYIDSNWIKVVNTGFETVFADDIKKEAKSAWTSYFKYRKENVNDIYYIDSIVDLVKREKINGDVFPNNIDIVTGGFPCQDFSVAGKRLGFKSSKSHNGEKLDVDKPTIENRGQLYMWMREVISIVKPLLFVAENVKGLISLENAKSIIEHDFAEAADGGYMVVPAKVLQAANYGVPQSRERIIFYGFQKKALKKSAYKALLDLQNYPEYDPYPAATHSFSSDGNKLYPIVSCREAFVDLDEPEFSTDLSQTKYSKAKYLKHGQGNIEIKIDSISPTIRAEHHGNIEFRRLNIENGGKNIEEINSGLLQRRLSVRECARLQTFPDEYQFILPKTDNNVSVSASEAYKLIGNAVPCVLAYNIAMRLSENWDRYFKT